MCHVKDVVVLSSYGIGIANTIIVGIDMKNIIWPPRNR